MLLLESVTSIHCLPGLPSDQPCTCECERPFLCRVSWCWSACSIISSVSGPSSPWSVFHSHKSLVTGLFWTEVSAVTDIELSTRQDSRGWRGLNRPPRGDRTAQLLCRPVRRKGPAPEVCENVRSTAPRPRPFSSRSWVPFEFALGTVCK